MKIDNVTSAAEEMGNLLKLIANETTDMSKKLVSANVAEKVRAVPGDTMGQNIDTYA